MEMVMGLINKFLNFVVPPVSMMILALSWPALFFLRTLQWIYRRAFMENMENKVVIITAASSPIGEQIVYEYSKRRTNLVLVAKKEQRLMRIRENARLLGAKQVLIMAADVMKEEDCCRFVTDTVNIFGRLDHLVNTTNLAHTFYFEEAKNSSLFSHLMNINFWGNVYPTYAALPFLRQSHGRILVNASVESWLPMPRMSLYAAAKAAVINFYETLRFEVDGNVGITIATHGWICGDQMGRSRPLVEGSEMQPKEEWEVAFTGNQVAKFARSMVAGACRGDSYIKHPNWCDVFILYRAIVPDMLSWTLHLIFTAQAFLKHSIEGAEKMFLDHGGSPMSALPGPSLISSPLEQKNE